MTSGRVGGTRGIVHVLFLSLLCAACGAPGTGPRAAVTAHPSFTYGPTDPVCGTDIGPSAPLNGPVMLDVSREGPTPPPILDSASGQILLQLTPGCEHGDQVRINPSAAAEIIRRAPAADGLLAGIAIQAHARHFQIIGTGAVAFDQTVALACPGQGLPCPADPSEPFFPTPSPTHTA
jgi:hypothetical protein